MMRCQVMADRIFDPAFVRASLQPLGVGTCASELKRKRSA
jgi:hypothetical protein